MPIWPSFQTDLPGSWTGSPLADPSDRLQLLQLKVVALTILLVPLNWLLGTTLPFVYCATACLLMAPQRLSAVEIALASLAGALLLGLVIAIPQGIEFGRIVAALFNLSIVLVVIVFANFGRKIQWLADLEGLRTDRIYRAAFACFWIQVAVVLGTNLYVILTGQQQLEFPTLLMGFAGELPGVLNLYSRATLSTVDWLGEASTPRMVGLGIYATEGALLLVVVGLFGAIHMANRRHWVGLLLVEITIIPVLLLTASRTTTLAYLMSLPLLLALFGRRVLGAALLLAPALLAGSIALGIHALDLGPALFSAISEARAGSSAGRVANYTLAIDLVLEHNVLTGLGVKPRNEAIAEIPIGSHSTWISMFTKGGLVALAALAVVYVLLIAKLVAAQIALYLRASGFEFRRRVELIYLSRCVLIVLLWWITEDFDVPAHQAVMAGLSFGLFWGLSERSAAERAGPVRLGAFQAR